MRKQLAVAFGLAVVATPALATKARLQALGEEVNGSYYINDNRNYFLNPARINNHKDLVTYEFGANGDTSATATDSAATPKAEGGFTKGMGNLVWGAHFGNTSPTAGTIRSLAGLPEVQPWDLFVGGDAGMKWGANLTYEDYSAGNNQTATHMHSRSMRARGGVMMGDMELFGHVSLMNNAKDRNTGDKVDGDLGFLVGASTMVQNYRLYADLVKIGAEYRNTTVGMTTDEDVDVTRLRVGAGRQERLNDRATMFARVSVERLMVEDDGTAGLIGGAANVGENTPAAPVAGEYTTWVIPLNVGLEYAATSWLDLRGSVGQNVFSMVEVDPKTGKDIEGKLANTVVRAGASLKFGEFSVDGLVSTDANGDGAGMDAQGTTGTGNGTLRADNLMTRVSMIYRF